MAKRICAWVFLGLLILLCAACTGRETVPAPTPAVDTERLPILEESEATTATVYYATLDKKYLVPLALPINSTKEVARVAMEKLLAGPPTAAAAPVLPQDTKLLDLYSSRSTVYVNVTKEIREVSWSQAQLAVDAILCTILPLVDGYTLQLLIEGQVCDRLGSVDIGGPLSLPYVNVDAPSREFKKTLTAEGLPLTSAALTYYLGDSAAMFLVPQTLFYQPEPEEAELEQEPHDEQESLPTLYARAVILAMLEADEEESGLTCPFWPGTELLDLWVEDNIVYVDFSARLIGYGGGAAAESLMLSCLTHSLTALPGISAVQVLIEGKAGVLPEGLDISKPLTPSSPLNAI